MALFKLPGHYVFDYKPLYYDPKKEDRVKRINRIKKELGIEIENDKVLKPALSFNRPGIYRKKKEVASFVRLIMILSILTLIVVLLLFTNYLEKITEFLVK